MRKRKKGRKFSRDSSQRRALMKSQARALVLAERIKTTKAKAKEISGFVEKLITKAKNKDLATTRYLSMFFDKSVVKKLTDEIGPRYAERKGGYTRIVKIGQRKTDGAEMVIIELIK